MSCLDYFLRDWRPQWLVGEQRWIWKSPEWEECPIDIEELKVLRAAGLKMASSGEGGQGTVDA